MTTVVCRQGLRPTHLENHAYTPTTEDSMSACPLPGTPSPAFSLSNTAGATVRLEDFQRQWLVLYFYPKDNTPGCTTEALEFSALLPEFVAEQCRVLGISPDSVQAHQNFTAKHNLTVDLASDPEHRVLELFGAWRLKKNYGKEYMGVARSTVLLDPHGVVAHVWANVKATGHAADVLAKVRELRARA